MSFPHDNGCLAKVRGEEIAAGSQFLPSPAEGQPEYLAVEIETVTLGRVRITYHLQSYKRGKIKYWHWVAKHAELAT